jgi:chaperonin GroEL (HSP60 family)
MGLIYVGGNSEVEVNETRDRIVDCLNATKNAIKEVGKLFL